MSRSKTIHGKGNHPLANPRMAELVTAWGTVFRQGAPAQSTRVQLMGTIVAATSSLRLDFEIMKQRGLAFNGETVR